MNQASRLALLWQLSQGLNDGQYMQVGWGRQEVKQEVGGKRPLTRIGMLLEDYFSVDLK
jgi:hypothetical protein